MAFAREKLGGNVNANAKQCTLFIYLTGDDLADVSATDYFKEANGSAPVPGMTGSGDNILFKDDIILISAADGYATGVVLASGASVALVETEV